MGIRRILGIDYGSRRIGIAVSDPLGIIARGITVIQNTPKAIDELKKLVTQYDVEKIVVGLPLMLNGQRGKKSEEVEEFANRLEREIGLVVVRCDERFTSAQAHHTMREMGMKKMQRRSKEIVDEMAAALILQGYLDRNSTRDNSEKERSSSRS